MNLTVIANFCGVFYLGLFFLHRRFLFLLIFSSLRLRSLRAAFFVA
jgi:hypothetical protein